jgi:hypothetical protein
MRRGAVAFSSSGAGTAVAGRVCRGGVHETASLCDREFGSAGTATGIPAGGHVPREYFKLNASDYRNPEGSEAAFYGYTDKEGTKVLARMKDGKSFVVEPQLAPAPLRKRVDWLRSFRFFVYFHPTESSIEQVSVFTRGGRLIYRTKSVEGGFF